MTNQISDDDAVELLRGRTPAGRPELAPLAESLADLHAAAFASAPQPSAELSARLAVNGHADVGETAIAVSKTRGTRKMVAWFTGLGVLAKILLASTVAAAAVVGTGAAGVLPGGAQQTFDDVISVVVPAQTEEQPTAEPTSEPTTEPTGDAEEGEHPDNFGGDVSEEAQDKPGSGYEFGKWVSETAKNKHHQDDTDVPSDDTTDGTDDDGGTAPGNSGDNGGGKPDNPGNSGSSGNNGNNGNSGNAGNNGNHGGGKP